MVPCIYLHAIWSNVRVDQGTIPLLKEDIQDYLLIKNQDCIPTDRYFLNVFMCPAGLNQPPSTCCSVTVQPLVAYEATIPHLKEDIYIFHMGCISMICNKRLHSYQCCKRLSLICLVPSGPPQEWKCQRLRRQ